MFICLNTQGLSNAEAQRRLKIFGTNELTPPDVVPEYVRFLKNLLGGFAILLWIGCFLCFIAYGIQVAQFRGVDVPTDHVRLSVLTYSYRELTLICY